MAGVGHFFKDVFVTNLQRYALNHWNSVSLAASYFATLHSNKSGRPKQPANSFLLYLKKQEKDRNLSQTQFVSVVAQKWREMSQIEKQPFIDLQKELALKYQADLELYQASLSIEDKETYLEEFRRNKLKRQKRSHKKSRFDSMRIDSLREGANVLKDATALWGSMLPEQKQPFVDKAVEDRVRYSREMQEYVEKLREEGKSHLLPVKYQRLIAAEERRAAKAK